MKQEQIKYRDIIDLGFKEKLSCDSVYYDQYGYDYCIITKKLTKKIYLDWEKENRLCTMVRMSSPKNGEIAAKLPVNNLDHLKEIINFFCD